MQHVSTNAVYIESRKNNYCEKLFQLPGRHSTLKAAKCFNSHKQGNKALCASLDRIKLKATMQWPNAREITAMETAEE